MQIIFGNISNEIMGKKIILGNQKCFCTDSVMQNIYNKIWIKKGVYKAFAQYCNIFIYKKEINVEIGGHDM